MKMFKTNAQKSICVKTDKKYFNKKNNMRMNLFLKKRGIYSIGIF